MRGLRLLAFALAALGGTDSATAAPRLEVVGTAFRLVGDGPALTSRDLVGAVLELEVEGAPLLVRIDGVEVAAERPGVLLHQFSVRESEDRWRPLCEADAQGREAGFPLAGRWEDGRFVADPQAFFLTCTSGSQGKCVLWGYDPWAQGPGGASLSRLYQACQQMVRADYLGEGRARTRDGTAIDIADIAGVQAFDSLDAPGFTFEAGWDERGAVCIGATRWPDLARREELIAARPELDGPCDQAAAIERGALLFTRIAPRRP